MYHRSNDAVIIHTIEEQVKRVILKYLYDTIDDFTCMRLMKEILPITGEGANVLVLADSKTDSLEVSFVNNGILNKFVLLNGEVKHETKRINE
jgi:hypothetical protein